jgi:hypothetical protein
MKNINTFSILYCFEINLEYKNSYEKMGKF